MLLRMHGDRDFKLVLLACSGDELGGACKALRMWLEHCAGAARRIAAQRHQMTHARAPVCVQHLFNLIAISRDTGEMRSRAQRCFFYDTRNSAMRAAARRAA